MTILDCCISLKTNKKILVVLGVVDMRQLLLKRFCLFLTEEAFSHCRLKTRPNHSEPSDVLNAICIIQVVTYNGARTVK